VHPSLSKVQGKGALAIVGVVGQASHHVISQLSQGKFNRVHAYQATSQVNALVKSESTRLFDINCSACILMLQDVCSDSLKRALTSAHAE
jgi:hypothetical protein